MTTNTPVGKPQEPEGDDEVAEDQEASDVLPALVHPQEVPRGLLGNVPVPDEEELAEAGVGPKAGEAEHQLPGVVEVTHGQGVGQHAVLGHPQPGEAEDGEAGHHGAGEDDHVEPKVQQPARLF